MLNSPLLQSYHQVLWPPPGRPICGFVMGLWLWTGPEGPVAAGGRNFDWMSRIRDPEGVRMNGDDFLLMVQRS